MPSPERNINAKKAIEIAVSHVSELWKVNSYKIRLEEIELADTIWIVTISIPKEESFIYTGVPTGKDYKIVKVDSNNGEILSVKIRE